LKYFILAGEASGDKQAALLCKSLRSLDRDAVMEGWGGEQMILQGVNVTVHYSKLAFMGFVEIIKHLPAILRNFKLCKKEILAFNPDALILVDYPGFNLRMATWAHKQNIPVYYYISPQLWAWHTSRVFIVKKAVRRMYVILPFEKEFYKNYGVDALYIGHPLAQEIQHETKEVHFPVKNQVALLPGSRKHEVELILPVMVALAAIEKKYSFKVVAVKHLPEKIYRDIIGSQENVELASGDMHATLYESEAAIVTSGTATLETALLGTPQIVVYKGNKISYQLAKRLIKVPFISLVNLIAGKQLVPELIQKDFTPQKMKDALDHVLANTSAIKQEYNALSDQLTSGGGPEAAAADIISDLHSIRKLQ